MAGCGGCGNCRGKCSKKSGWTPVRYYIMYESSVFVDFEKGWHLLEKKVKLLENAADEEEARIEAGKWLIDMRKRGYDFFRIDSAKLVASTHKDVLKLI